MFFAQGLYKKITKFAPFSRLNIPFMLAGIMAFTWPDLLCGGDAVAVSALAAAAGLTEEEVLRYLVALQARYGEADRIVGVPCNMMDKPNEDQVIRTITIK